MRDEERIALVRLAQSFAFQENVGFESALRMLLSLRLNLITTKQTLYLN